MKCKLVYFCESFCSTCLTYRQKTRKNIAMQACHLANIFFFFHEMHSLRMSFPICFEISVNVLSIDVNFQLVCNSKYSQHGRSINFHLLPLNLSCQWVTSLLSFYFFLKNKQREEKSFPNSRQINNTINTSTH